MILNRKGSKIVSETSLSFCVLKLFGSMPFTLVLAEQHNTEHLLAWKVITLTSQYSVLPVLLNLFFFMYPLDISLFSINVPYIKTQLCFKIRIFVRG